MCGIAGFSGSFDPVVLERMNDLQAHRGPDDLGVWFDWQERIGLAHRRLSIIDLSKAGHQPMQDENTSTVICYNGEIYNYRQLRYELEKQGYVFKSTSDTEVLLKLYRSFGRELLSHVNGIFAFAIWDGAKEELFLARDNLGVKPLYYAKTDKGFIFASELKAILLEPSLDRTIDVQTLRNYLVFLWSPAPATPIKSVWKLEPGQCLLVKHGGIVDKWNYYDIPFDGEISGSDYATIIRDLQGGIDLAVQRQMVSDVEVGAFLSGGLDSSAVVAFARKYSPYEPFRCFSINTDFEADGAVNDIPFARKTSAFLNTQLHEVRADKNIIRSLPTIVYHLDEPQADPAPFHVYSIAQLARNKGIKVLLSGAGGDDLFTGYRRHFALMQEMWWNWLPLAGRKVLRRLSERIPLNSSRLRRFSKAFRFADMPQKERLISYFFWMRPEMVADLFLQDFSSLLEEDTPYAPLRRSLSRLSSKEHILNQMLYLEQKHFLPDHNLQYTDKMGMAHGVEIRVPLLDVDLVKTACGLPVDYKQRGKEGKWIFKKAMQPFLPQEIVHRPKTGFGAPMRSWIKNDLTNVIGEVLSRESIQKRGIFDPSAVDNLIRQNKLNKIDASYTIFSLVCIELWMRMFIDGSSPQELEESF